MTRRGTYAAAAVVVAVGAIAVFMTTLPNDYDCPAFAVRGGDVTSLDGRNFTCGEATGLIKALFRGEGHPRRGSQAVILRRWRCVRAAGLASCTRGRHRWIKAHYTLRR